MPFKIRSVGIELRTVQKVTTPSTIGSTTTIREYKVYEDPFAFRPPHNEFTATLLGLDIPVLIPLPRDIISSGKFPLWDASTTHQLCVIVSCGDSVENELIYMESFPVAIKLYDTLPLYRQFNEPIVETRTSTNQQVMVDISMPVSSVGPRDSFTMFVKVLTNAQNNKVKKNLRLNKLTLQIKEILECHDGGLPSRRESKLFTRNRILEYDGSLLTTQGISHVFQLDFPSENEYLQMYSRTSSDMAEAEGYAVEQSDMLSIQQMNIPKNIQLNKLDEGIPHTHTQGFTTLGKLFTIRYEVVLKVNMSHAKDIEVRIPLTVSPYDRESSDYLLRWIMRECEVARDKFGRNLIAQVASSLRYEDTLNLLGRFRPPPVLYKNIRPDWVRLGYSSETFGSKSGKNLVQLID